MNPAIYALLGVIASVIGSIAVAKLSERATARQTQTQGDLGAGALALQIANRADRKVSRVERRMARLDAWRREVTDEWWPAHDARDRIIEGDLLKLDPDAVIPQRPQMPRYVADDDDTDTEPAE